MRTTLDLDEDVLRATKNLATLQRRSLGKVVSELLRSALAPRGPQAMRNGLELLSVDLTTGPITPELVERLLEDD